MRGTVAVVVARSGSRRIPRKGHALIGGCSLVERKVRQLVATRGVDRVVVGSDDETMRVYADRHGAVFVQREARYCDEQSETPDAMVRDMLRRPECEAEWVLWAHPTNPLVGASEYEQALALGEPCMSVYALHGHVWRSTDGQAVGWEPRRPWPLASSLPPLLVQDGAIFFRRWADMAADGLFAVDGMRPCVLPREVGWDVNEPWELDVARWLVDMQKKP